MWLSYLNCVFLFLIGNFHFCNLSITFPTSEDNLQVFGAQRFPVTDGSIAFGLKTLEDLVDSGKNAVISPVSVRLCMILLYLGAKGDTKTELSHLVGSGANGSVLSEINQLPGVSAATATFVDANTVVKSTYASSIQNAIYSVQFSDASSTDLINKWVSDQTLGTIPSLLQSTLPPSTKAVAISALYFKAAWLHPFSPAATKTGKFDVSPEYQVDVPLMTVDATLPVFRSPSYSVVGLPYDNNGFTLYLIIPQATGTRALKNVLRQLSVDEINKMLTRMSDAPSIVTMPRLQLDFRIPLRRSLQRHGLNKMFDPVWADFGDMISENTEPKLCVDEVYHSVHMEIDEGGTRASAATAAVLTKSGRWVFRATRPFAFFLRHSSGHVLFVGTVVNPTASG